MRDRKKQLTPSVDVSDEVMPSLIKSIEQVDGEWKKKKWKRKEIGHEKMFFFFINSTHMSVQSGPGVES